MISIEDASAAAEVWERERKNQPAYQIGIALNREMKGLRSVVEDLNADAANDAGCMESYKRSIAELCAAIGVERGTDPWPDFLARVRTEVERTEVEQPPAGCIEGGHHMGDLHFHHPGTYQIQGEISIRLDDSMAGGIDELKAMLTQKAEFIMAALDALRAAVEGNTSVDQSAIVLLNGLSQQLRDALAASADKAALEAAVEEIANQLSSENETLAAAVSANTPADAGGGA